jgi:hypothetical protein
VKLVPTLTALTESDADAAFQRWVRAGMASAAQEAFAEVHDRAMKALAPLAIKDLQLPEKESGLGT